MDRNMTSTKEENDEEPLSLAVRNDNLVRLETPSQIVEVSHETSVHGSGISWISSRTISKRNQRLEVIEPSDQQGSVMLQIPLSGDFRMWTSDRVRVSGRNIGLTLPREKWLLYDLVEGEDTKLFTVSALPKTVADWFGGKIPEALHRVMADKHTSSLHWPVEIPQILEDSLRLSLHCNTPLRQVAVEGAALQIFTHCLQQ